MGLNNPLPVSLSAECRKATKLFYSFVDPVKGADGIIPSHVLRKAKGFAFLTVSKVGFIMSARAGTGVVIARTADGGWSAPSAVGTAGAGFGFQAGAEMTEFIIILNSRAAVRSFMAAGSLTLGGNMSVAAGPIGRNLEGNGTISSKGGLAAMYSYSRTKGLFGGASIEGSVIVERSDANAKAYGYSVTAAQLLSGNIDVPDFARGLVETISRISGGAEGWEEDADDWNENGSGGGTPREGKGYAFGTSFASGGVDTPTSSSRPGILGSLGGRSRSASSTSAGRNGPMPTGGYNFDQDFGDEYSRERDAELRRENPSGPKAKLMKKSGSGSGAAGVKGFVWDESRDRAGTRRKSLGSRNRNEYDFEAEDDFAGSSTARRGGGGGSAQPRASFDSLDDDEGGRYQHPNDDYSRPAKPTLARKYGAGSSFSRPSSASPFSDPEPSPSRPSPTSKKSYQSRPWDSEDEDLMSFGAATRSRSGTVTTTPKAATTPRGDPFDFSEVAVDFTRSVGGRDGYANLSKGTTAERERSKSRSRSGTVGGGLGTAIGLFDFNSTEPGDLPFKKGDVITIIKQDDEEWWTGRIALKEGIVPRNYLEFHPGV